MGLYTHSMHSMHPPGLSGNRFLKLGELILCLQTQSDQFNDCIWPDKCEGQTITHANHWKHTIVFVYGNINVFVYGSININLLDVTKGLSPNLFQNDKDTACQISHGLHISLISNPQKTFGITWNTNCMPGLFVQHKCSISLMLLWLNAQIPTPKSTIKHNFPEERRLL